MSLVHEIMTRGVVSLLTTQTLDEAAQILTAAGVSGAPVRDAKHHVVGVLSHHDLSAARAKGSETVADAMTDGVWAVSPECTARDAARIMVDHGIHRLVVMRGPDSVAGILTTLDLLRAFLDDETRVKTRLPVPDRVQA